MQDFIQKIMTEKYPMD